MQDLARATRVTPGSKVDLGAHPPDAQARPAQRGERPRARTAKRAERMAELATMLMAEHKRAVLVVLQGMDASGKDGTVKHCLGGLNPMSVRVAGFKAPNSTELAHDFLWRIRQVLPQRGEIGIFNRSHYEDVLVVRVEELVPKQVWKKRYAAINAFEQHLANEGTTVVKLFLHISEEEQAKRFRERIVGSHEELEVLGRRPREAREVERVHGRPTAPCSSARRRRPLPGTSCPPTTSGCATPSSPRCSRRRSRGST